MRRLTAWLNRLWRKPEPVVELPDFAPESDDGPLSLPPDTLRARGFGVGQDMSDRGEKRGGVRGGAE